MTFAIAVDRTLASVLGYVVYFFSYSVCAILRVSSGLILKRLEHSACNSLRLNRSGAFFFSTVFFTESTVNGFPPNKEIRSSAVFLSLNPLSLYKNGVWKYFDPATAFHSACIPFPISATTRKNGVTLKSRISRSLFTTIPSTHVMTRPTEIGVYLVVPAAWFSLYAYFTDNALEKLIPMA